MTPHNRATFRCWSCNHIWDEQIPSQMSGKKYISCPVCNSTKITLEG